VCGFAQILARQSLADQQARSVEHILLAGRHASSLLDGVLDIACVEDGPPLERLVPVDVGAIAAEAVALVQTSAAQRGVFVESCTGGEMLRGDAGAVRQVLVNLLSNAVKYGRSGGRVSVRAAVAGPVVRVEVVDDGPGIAEDHQRALFYRFGRGGLDRNDRRGAGLGLALCRRLIESMNGSIGVRSDLGLGSTFWFELPIVRPLSDHDAIVVVVAVPDAATLELVDLAIGAMPGVRVHPVRAAGSAADLVRRERPDVLLTDLDLPGVYELVTRAHVTSPGTAVIALTADQQVSRRTGVHAGLRKPCSVDDLVAAVSAQLEVRR
jgi:CheY-like chemotaxis protein